MAKDPMIKLAEKTAGEICDDVAQRKYILTGLAFAVQERLNEEVLLTPRAGKDTPAVVYTQECEWKRESFRRHFVYYKTPDFGRMGFTPDRSRELIRVAIDVGHELGHLVVEGPPGKLQARPGIPPQDLWEIEEAECDFFAICVLQMYGMVFPDQTV